MTFPGTSLAIVVATAGILVCSSGARAASSHHIDEVASRLQRQAAELARELKHHYRHAPQYRHLISDARQLERGAAHVHKVAHSSGNLKHLNDDLRKLDRAAHHLDEVMEDIADHIDHCHNQRCGHFHGDIRQAEKLIERIQQTVHHLKKDVRTALYRPHRDQRHGRHYVKRHGNGGRYGDQANYSRNRYSLAFGGRGWSVHLGSR